MSTTEQESSEPSGLHAFLAEPDDGPGAEPVADGSPLAEQAFYLDPEARGDRSRFVATGGVRFNRAVPYRLRVEDLEPMARRREGVDGLRLELVKFTFTVLDLPRGSSYERVHIRITLDPPYPLMQLRPRSEATQSQRSSSFSQEARPLLLKLLQLDLKLSATTNVDVTESRPVVTALDLNADGFDWIFQAQDGAPLSPGIRQTVAVLELPHDVGGISGSFDAEAVLTRRLLGLVSRPSTVPAPQPAPFDIRL